MCQCTVILKDGKVQLLSVEIKTSLTLNELILTSQLSSILCKEHRVIRNALFLNPDDVIAPEDSLIFLLPVKLSATSWRRSRLLANKK
jgi:hypothetical protein